MERKSRQRVRCYYRKLGRLAAFNTSKYLLAITCLMPCCTQQLVQAEIIVTLPESPLPRSINLPSVDPQDPLFPPHEDNISSGLCPPGFMPECGESTMTQLSTQTECQCQEDKPQNQCSYFIISDNDINVSVEHHGESMLRWTPAAGSNFSNFDVSTLSCLEQIATKCHNKELLMYVDKVPNVDNMPKERDRCVVSNFGKYIGGDTYALDADCNQVQTADVKDEICGTLELTYIISPISLILDELDVESLPHTVVRFPLAPQLGALWYPWKASANMPLLVYDPKHSGTITDGSQLFGNWTFGGKKFSALESKTSFASSSSTSAWENGFEALGTLDSDLDNKLDGEELSPLGLWFDYDQNGIAQDGEVKSLRESGIVTLYYQPDRADSKSIDIYATRGYQRIVNGRRITGAAVDWFSEASESKVEAMAKLQAHTLKDN